MNKNLWKLLIFNLSTDVIGTFVLLFVNLFIWQKDKSVVDLAWFNLSQFFIWMIAHTIGSWVIHKTSLRAVFQLGNVFALFLFLVLSFITLENKLAWLILIGACTGFMKGFLASGKNLGTAEFGGKENFQQYFQYLTLFSKVMQIFTPIVFAVILTLVGYKGAFLIMCVYSILLFGFTYWIPNNQNHNKEPLFKHIFSPFKTRAAKLLPLSFMTGAIFSEFQGVFLVVFTFNITEDKFGVALLNIAYSLLIMGLIYLNRKLERVNGVHWLYIGSTLAFLGFGLITFLEDWWLVVANFLIVAGNFYFSTTYYSQQYEVMDDLEEIDKKRMIMWRENLLAFSRMMLLLMIILMGNITEQTMYYLFFGVMTITFFVPIVHKKMLSQ